MSRWPLLGVCVAMLLAVLLAPQLVARRPVQVGFTPTNADPGAPQTTGDALRAGLEVDQPIIQPRDGLSEIDIYIEVIGPRGPAALKGEVDEGARVVRSATGHIDDDRVRFEFEPIAGSATRNLTFRLTSPGASDATLVAPMMSAGAARAMPMGLRYGPARELDAQQASGVARASAYKPGVFRGDGIVLVCGVAGLLAIALVAAICMQREDGLPA
jgi:hypothetical protein